MELRHVRTLIAVVEHRTLIAAARVMGCSQATVTLHIQELERELGAPLFDRIGKSVVITDAGRRAHGRAVHLLDAVDEMKRDVAAAYAGDRGLVRIGAIEPTASVRLPPLLRRLAQDRPGVTVRLEIGGTGTISQRVASADLDIGIATAPPAEHGLAFEPLFEEPLVLALPAGSRTRGTVRARDVAAMTVLLTEDGCAYRRRIEELFSGHGQPFRVHQEIGSIGALLACVRAGMGVAIVPARAIPPGDASIVARKLADLPLHISVGVVSRLQAGGPSVLVAAVRERLASGLVRPHHTPRGSR